MAHPQEFQEPVNPLPQPLSEFEFRMRRGLVGPTRSEALMLVEYVNQYSALLDDARELAEAVLKVVYSTDGTAKDKKIKKWDKHKMVKRLEDLALMDRSGTPDDEPEQ